MARFWGSVGFLAADVEEEPGVWCHQIEERMYSGEIIRQSTSVQSSSSVNDGIRFSGDISIVLDPFAVHNYACMKYVTYMGVKWKIESVEVKYPRLILKIGGVWNEQPS